MFFRLVCSNFAFITLSLRRHPMSQPSLSYLQIVLSHFKTSATLQNNENRPINRLSV